MKKILMFMSALMLLCMTIISVCAIDLDQTGSITINLVDSDGNSVNDGIFTLYKIATTDGSSYTYTSSMDDCDILLDISNSTLAENLALYIDENHISGSSQAIDNGKLYYSNLNVGLYLIVQTTSSEDYYDISPVVISVPLEVDGEYIYHVDASPKVETVTTTTISTIIPPITPSDSTLPQTGMLLTPIIVLAMSGLILFAIGWKLSYGQKKSI